MYDVPLDEKYRIICKDGVVKILRFGEPWLENPPGAKAWIAAADTIEILLKGEEVYAVTPELKLFAQEELERKLAAVLGSSISEEARASVAESFANYLGLITRSTAVSPEDFLKALIS